MSALGVDPGAFYESDLSRGRLSTRQGTRVVVLSETVIGSLVRMADRTGDLTPMRALGKVLGEHVLEGLGGSIGEQTPELVLGHATALVSLFGWGRLELERWGDAVVVRLVDAPRLDEADLGVSALLGGVFSALVAKEVACVPVGEGRFILVSPYVAEEVWSWAQEGLRVGAIVDRLAGDVEGAR